jgi:hypothetical protein
MRKEKEIETKNMENLVSKVAKKLADDKKEAFETEENFEELDELDENEYGDRLAEQIGFDLFDYCEQLQKTKNDAVIYVIKRNGEMLTTRYHPCSWEMIQKAYGPGSYQVMAKSSITKKFLKSETRALAAVDETEFAFGRKPEVQHVNTTPQGPGFMEMFALMKDTEDKGKAEAREMAKEQAMSSNNMMQLVVTMMQTTNNQSQNMFIEMAKINATIADKLTESQSRMFEKMEDRFEKILENIGTKEKDKGMSVLELMKMSEDAQKKGFDMFDKIGKIAEIKAAERVAMLEENRPTGRSKDSSLVEKLIDNVLPTVTNAIAAGQRADQENARRALYSGTLPNAPQTFRPRPRTQTAQGTGSVEAKNTTGTQNGEHGRPLDGSNSEQNIVNSLGLPTMNTETVIISKERIEELISPEVGKSMLLADTPKVGAEKIRNMLRDNNITVKLFLDAFKKEDITNIVTKYSLPIEAVAWLEGVYADIEIAS